MTAENSATRGSHSSVSGQADRDLGAEGEIPTVREG